MEGLGDHYEGKRIQKNDLIYRQEFQENMGELVTVPNCAVIISCDSLHCFTGPEHIASTVVFIMDLVSATQRAYQREFGVLQSSQKEHNTRTGKQIGNNWISEHRLEESPKKSLRRLSQETRLQEPDKDKRLNYCRWFQTFIVQNPAILSITWNLWQNEISGFDNAGQHLDRDGLNARISIRLLLQSVVEPETSSQTVKPLTISHASNDSYGKETNFLNNRSNNHPDLPNNHPNFLNNHSYHRPNNHPGLPNNHPNFLNNRSYHRPNNYPGLPNNHTNFLNNRSYRPSNHPNFLNNRSYHRPSNHPGLSNNHPNFLNNRSYHRPNNFPGLPNNHPNFLNNRSYHRPSNHPGLSNNHPNFLNNRSYHRPSNHPGLSNNHPNFLNNRSYHRPNNHPGVPNNHPNFLNNRSNNHPGLSNNHPNFLNNRPHHRSNNHPDFLNNRSHHRPNNHPHPTPSFY
ncbi:hypothetical protein ANN_16932 [Periplaneta americana]|uniref:Uncharacterized protein n=1 Tax=Periplaneta americana TaxID=6978 RepID=A0ABQ8STM4_PERAM|nr:hypothetical protein ANN_16932 [Periplaneta americana]